MNKTTRLNPKIISLIVIVLIAVASTGVYAANQSAKKASTTASTTQAAADTSDTATGSSSASSSSYKDGTYTETGTYITPGGGESVTVTVTLSGNTITDVSTTGSATRGDSSEYQSQFLSNYKQYVVGKSIDSVSLSRVAGSSLTSTGFNKALTQIKEDAAA